MYSRETLIKAWPCCQVENYPIHTRDGQIFHYNDVLMSAMTSQITSVSIVYSTVCSGVDQRKHQIDASLVFVCGIHRWPMNSPQKGPVTLKMLQFDDIIMHMCIAYLIKLWSMPEFLYGLSWSFIFWQCIRGLWNHQLFQYVTTNYLIEIWVMKYSYMHNISADSKT